MDRTMQRQYASDNYLLPALGDSCFVLMCQTAKCGVPLVPTMRFYCFSETRLGLDCQNCEGKPRITIVNSNIVVVQTNIYVQIDVMQSEISTSVYMLHTIVLHTFLLFQVSDDVQEKYVDVVSTQNYCLCPSP